MFLTIATIFPCLVALTWGFVYLFSKNKSRAQELMLVMLFLEAAYMYVDSYFINPSLSFDDYKLLVWLDVVAQYVVFALPVLACFYVATIENNRPAHPASVLFFVPGLILSTVVLVFATIVGTEPAARFLMDYDAAGGFPATYQGNAVISSYSFFTKDLFKYLFLVEFVAAFIFLFGGCFVRGYRPGDVFRFLFKGKASRLSNVTALLLIYFFLFCIIRICFPKSFLLSHQLIVALISLVFAGFIFALAYAGLFLSVSGFTRQDLGFSRHMPEEPLGKKADEETVEAPALLTDEFPADAALPAGGEAIQGKKSPEDMEKTVQSLPPQQRLFFNFSMYMVEERPYLNPELTIIDVATALHSNRTYISALVAERYGMPFRDYINTQRINFSKTYILTHPDAILEEVAAASGFASASQFVKKFHQIENVSPRIWQANPDLSHNKIEE